MHSDDTERRTGNDTPDDGTSDAAEPSGVLHDDGRVPPAQGKLAAIPDERFHPFPAEEDSYLQSLNFSESPADRSASKPLNFTPYIVFSIIETGLCCGCGSAFGIASLILTMQAKSLFDSGSLPKAQSKLKIAKILLILGPIVTISGSIIYALITLLRAGDDAETPRFSL